MVMIRQIKITNYVTGAYFFKEVTPEQHDLILKTKAETGATIDIELVKEREL